MGPNFYKHSIFVEEAPQWRPSLPSSRARALLKTRILYLVSTLSRLASLLTPFLPFSSVTTDNWGRKKRKGWLKLLFHDLTTHTVYHSV